MGGDQSAGSEGPDSPDGPGDPQGPAGPDGLPEPQVPYDDGENALRVLRIIEAAYKSSETGRMVSLDQDREG